MWMQKWNYISSLQFHTGKGGTTHLTVRGRSFSVAFDVSPSHRNRSPAQLATDLLDRMTTDNSLVYFMTVTFKYALTHMCLKWTLMANPRN